MRIAQGKHGAALGLEPRREPSSRRAEVNLPQGGSGSLGSHSNNARGLQVSPFRPRNPRTSRERRASGRPHRRWPRSR